MDIVDAVESRRSIRAFRPDPVDPAIIRRVLARAAGEHAPVNNFPVARAPLEAFVRFHGI